MIDRFFVVFWRVVYGSLIIVRNKLLQKLEIRGLPGYFIYSQKEEKNRKIYSVFNSFIELSDAENDRLNGWQNERFLIIALMNICCSTARG